MLKFILWNAYKRSVNKMEFEEQEPHENKKRRNMIPPFFAPNLP